MTDYATKFSVINLIWTRLLLKAEKLLLEFYTLLWWLKMLNLWREKIILLTILSLIWKGTTLIADNFLLGTKLCPLFTKILESDWLLDCSNCKLEPFWSGTTNLLIICTCGLLFLEMIRTRNSLTVLSGLIRDLVKMFTLTKLNWTPLNP